jgi:hypothetical protein
MRLLAATFFACLMVVGCGEKDEPEPVPEPAPVDVTETAIADAPPGIQEVEYGKYCGEEDRTLGQRAVEVPECIKTSLAEGAPAWGTITQNTVEGDPIPTTYVARSERDVLVFTDSTKDEFGSQSWIAESCRHLDNGSLFTRKCGRPIEVDEETPSEFLERETLPDCGRLGINLANFGRGSARFYSPAFECFNRALTRGTPAELFARSTSEEGPVEFYLRARENGTIERFADATRGGTGPRAWYYDECNRLGMYVTLRGCTNRTELSNP